MRRAIVFLALVSCYARKSDLSYDVSTRDMSMTAALQRDELLVTLRGFGNMIELFDPDRLQLRQGDRTWPFVHVPNGYTTHAPESGGPMTIELVRGEDATAIEAIVMPPVFAIVAPSVISRASGFGFDWGGSGGANVRWSVTGPCMKPVMFDGPDEGAHFLVPAELIGMGSCTIKIEVTRTWARTGPASLLQSFDAKFERSASLELRSDP